MALIDALALLVCLESEKVGKTGNPACRESRLSLPETRDELLDVSHLAAVEEHPVTEQTVESIGVW